jgi:hypothetical protein
LSAIVTRDQAEEDVAELARWLYDRCYTHSILSPEPDDVAADDGEFVSLLAAANQSRAGWEEGWTIDQPLANGRILARKHGAVRTFVAGEYVSSRGPGCGPEAEGPVMIFRVSESRTLQTSYYYSFGEAVCPFEETTGMLRFYWNIAATDAPQLMKLATASLNRFQIPFHMKFPAKRSSYGRRDAVVLYVHRWYYRITALVLEPVYANVANCLRPDTPLFTKELAPGLGFAEDPGGSFGEHRCRILAQCLLQCRTRTVREKLQAVHQAFRERGLSLAHSWLNPGSSDDYQFPFPAA